MLISRNDFSCICDWLFRMTSYWMMRRWNTSKILLSDAKMSFELILSAHLSAMLAHLAGIETARAPKLGWLSCFTTMLLCREWFDFCELTLMLAGYAALLSLG